MAIKNRNPIDSYHCIKIELEQVWDVNDLIRPLGYKEYMLICQTLVLEVYVDAKMV